MSQPLISIIIPTRNTDPAILLQTITSIENQSYQHKEILIVNDGGEVPNIPTITTPIILYTQPHGGAPKARNTGLSHAQGEFVICWDAGVVGKPHMIETLVHALTQDTDASFAYSNFYFGHKKMRGQPHTHKTLKQNNYIMSTTLVRKKDALQWDETLKRFQDWDYFLMLTEQGKRGVWIDQYLFTVHTGGTMSTWLPSFAYKKPWRYLPWWKRTVASYLSARDILYRKHNIET